MIDAAGPARRTALWTESVGRLTGRDGGVDDLRDWLAGWRERIGPTVRRIPMGDLDHWRLRGDPTRLAHDSGRFFTVDAVTVSLDRDGRAVHWQQPILTQPEVGTLGIVTRRFDGVPHFLVQAKFEPGNPGGVQLSPTLQATRSNLARVHAGRRPAFAEVFGDPPADTVVIDRVQPEQGNRFLGKWNRNMVVAADIDAAAGGPVDPRAFRWATLGQVLALLAEDDIVGMDLRSVIACLLPAPPADPAELDAVAAWLSGCRAAIGMRVDRIGLDRVAGWRREADGALVALAETPQRFSVVAIAVEAGEREVARWCQPILAHPEAGTVGLAVRRGPRGPEALVRAAVEPGSPTVVELGPTWSSTASDALIPADGGTDALAALFAGPPGGPRPLVETALSEEGGRFLGWRHRYRIVALDAADAARVAPGRWHRWVALPELRGLLDMGLVSIELRTALVRHAAATAAAEPRARGAVAGEAAE